MILTFAVLCVAEIMYNMTERLVECIVLKVKWSRYRSGVAQRVGRGIALLFHDRGTRRGWLVSSTTRPHFTPRKEPVLILQETGRASGPVWTGGKSRPHRDLITDRPTRSQLLYQLSYPVHVHSSDGNIYNSLIWKCKGKDHLQDLGVDGRSVQWDFK